MAPSARQAVVTGLGTVNALGGSVAEFAAALRAGTSAIGPLELFDTTGYRSRIAAEVRDDVPPRDVAPALRRRLSRSDVFALRAAAEALAQSGVAAATAPERIGVALGGTTGGMLRAEEQLRARIERRSTRYASDAVIGAPISVSADVVAHAFGFLGPRAALSTACSSSANALGIALDWIRMGMADAVIAGGTESLCRMTFAGFNALHAL